jgi:hypothetical protein
MYLIHNERTKLTAAWFSTLATALVAAGVFAPGAALLYGFSQFSIGPGGIIVLALGCLCVGGGIHLLGRAMLGRLRE